MSDSAAVRLRVLIVDDEANIRLTLGVCLEVDGHEVVSHGTIAGAMAEVSCRAFDLIFLDIRIGTDDGLDYIQPLLAFNPWAKIVVITAYASVSTAVRAMKLGAVDYLPKPFSAAEVSIVTQGVADRRRLELELDALHVAIGPDPDADFQTASSVLQQTLALAKQVANGNSHLLISGEPGTGKRRLARAIHTWSRRAAAPFALVNVQGETAEQLDAELFGLCAEAGADAPPAVHGRAQLCDGGTLVINDVGFIPPSLQHKLLDLLKERRFERRDDFTARSADVRVIALTSTDLDSLVARQRLRSDLAGALDVVRVEVPPLRDRPEDIRPLAKRYLAHFAHKHGRRVAGFRTDALRAIDRYAWPGNVRELRNLVDRAVMLCDEDMIGFEQFPPTFAAAEKPVGVGDLIPLSELTDAHIAGVLAAAGSVRRAASILEIDYSTLRRRLQRSKDPAVGGALEVDPAEPSAS